MNSCYRSVPIKKKTWSVYWDFFLKSQQINWRLCRCVLWMLFLKIIPEFQAVQYFCMSFTSLWRRATFSTAGMRLFWGSCLCHWHRLSTALQFLGHQKELPADAQQVELCFLWSKQKVKIRLKIPLRKRGYLGVFYMQTNLCGFTNTHK